MNNPTESWLFLIWFLLIIISINIAIGFKRSRNEMKEINKNLTVLIEQGK